MRILFLTQYYAPEPAGKLVDVMRELQQRGHEVQVLTSYPCYPAGKVYTGYKQALFGRRETLDGIPLVRVPQLPDHSRSAFRRIAYYCSFAFSAIFLGLFRLKRPDAILVYQSALPTGLAAWTLSRLWRRPYVVDLADLWPESVAASGILTNRWILGTIRRLAKFVYDGAAVVNVITEGYRDNLQAMGVDPAKINLVRWWSAETSFDNALPSEQYATDEGFVGKFNLLYAGTIGPCQQLETVLDAAEQLQDLPDVQFTIAGDGVEREDLIKRTAAMKLTNVRFIGRRDRDEITKMCQLSELLLVHLKRDPMSELSIPSKTIDYLATGRPLLMAVVGEASRIVQEHGCGITVEPSNATQLAEAVRSYHGLSPAERSHYAKAARQTHQQLFSRDQQIDKVEASLAASIQTPRSNSWYQQHGKRWLDVAASGLAMLLMSPLLLAVAVAVRLGLGSPVLFSQERPGQNGRLFRMYKFRTMRDACDSQGQPLADERRLTRLGSWLRKTSLDELPGLWNILRGDMSLVGPRPLLPAYLDRYTDSQARRHEVRPGLTGLAQVRGRNSLAWEEKFELDVQYVENVSLSHDLKILLATVAKVVTQADVSADGHATMPEFMGTQASSTNYKQAA